MKRPFGLHKGEGLDDLVVDDAHAGGGELMRLSVYFSQFGTASPLRDDTFGPQRLTASAFHSSAFHSSGEVGVPPPSPPPPPPSAAAATVPSGPAVAEVVRAL